MLCMSDLGNAGSSDGHGDSNHVDRELELQELGNTVVHVSTPHDGLDDAGEVVVCQYDVRRLLCYVGSCDALWISS